MTETHTFLDGRVTLHAGDCREVLRGMADNSVDSVVTDPPYCLTSIAKRFGKDGSAPCKKGKDGSFARLSGGFMNAKWDNDVAFHADLWAEVLRVLKPGGYIMAFSGCRTYHRMACAIEDAGFITHPMFCYAFGSGFPKAHNLSKQLDKMAGVEREVISERNGVSKSFNVGAFETIKPRGPITAPATDAAREWDGWFYGTQSLKPAIEPVYFGQKPFERGLNGAQNVLKWGVGSVFIDGAKVRHRTMDTILNRARQIHLHADREFENSIFCKDPSPDADKFFRTLGKRLSESLGRLTAALHEDDRVQIWSSPPDCQGGYSIYSHLCDALFHISQEDVLSSVQQQLYARKHTHPSMLSDAEGHESVDTALYECVNLLSNLDYLLRSDQQANVRSSAESLSRAVEQYLKLFLECSGTELLTRLSPVHLHKVSQWLVLSPLEIILEGGSSGVDLACETILINILLGPHLITNSLHILIRIVEKHGRWPSNLLLDGSDDVLACFSETTSGDLKPYKGTGNKGFLGGSMTDNPSFTKDGDSGTAARFFYTAKADADDRLGSKHPTVKPLDLIQYFVRLTTPKNGVCLDHFAGTGTTAEACFREGLRSILIENDPESIADIERRISLVMEGPVTRANAGMKARGRPRDDGPLFNRTGRTYPGNRPTGSLWNGGHPFDETKPGGCDEAAE